MDGLEILDSVVLFKSGCYSRIRYWIRGKHPELGVLIWGFTGLETRIDKDVITSMGSYFVQEAK